MRFYKAVSCSPGVCFGRKLKADWFYDASLVDSAAKHYVFESSSSASGLASNTEVVGKVLTMIARGSKPGVSLLAGSRGAGKSHMALALAALLAGSGDAYSSVVSRLQRAQKGLDGVIRKLKDSPSIVCVLDGGNEELNVAAEIERLSQKSLAAASASQSSVSREAGAPVSLDDMLEAIRADGSAWADFEDLVSDVGSQIQLSGDLLYENAKSSISSYAEALKSCYAELQSGNESAVGATSAPASSANQPGIAYKRWIVIIDDCDAYLSRVRDNPQERKIWKDLCGRALRWPDQVRVIGLVQADKNGNCLDPSRLDLVGEHEKFSFSAVRWWETPLSRLFAMDKSALTSVVAPGLARSEKTWRSCLKLLNEWGAQYGEYKTFKSDIVERFYPMHPLAIFVLRRLGEGGLLHPVAALTLLSKSFQELAEHDLDGNQLPFITVSQLLLNGMRSEGNDEECWELEDILDMQGPDLDPHVANALCGLWAERVLHSSESGNFSLEGAALFADEPADFVGEVRSALEAKLPLGNIAAPAHAQGQSDSGNACDSREVTVAVATEGEKASATATTATGSDEITSAVTTATSSDEITSAATTATSSDEITSAATIATGSDEITSAATTATRSDEITSAATTATSSDGITSAAYQASAGSKLVKSTAGSSISVPSSKYSNGAAARTVSASDAAASRVNTCNAAGGTVVATNGAASNVASANVVAGSVATTKAAADTVVAANAATGKIATGTVGATKGAAGTVVTTKAAASTVATAPATPIAAEPVRILDEATLQKRCRAIISVLSVICERARRGNANVRDCLQHLTQVSDFHRACEASGCCMPDVLAAKLAGEEKALSDFLDDTLADFVKRQLCTVYDDVERFVKRMDAIVAELQAVPRYVPMAKTAELQRDRQVAAHAGKLREYEEREAKRKGAIAPAKTSQPPATVGVKGEHAEPASTGVKGEHVNPVSTGDTGEHVKPASTGDKGESGGSLAGASSPDVAAVTSVAPARGGLKQKSGSSVAKWDEQRADKELERFHCDLGDRDSVYNLSGVKNMLEDIESAWDCVPKGAEDDYLELYHELEWLRGVLEGIADSLSCDDLDRKEDEARAAAAGFSRHKRDYGRILAEACDESQKRLDRVRKWRRESTLCLEEAGAEALRAWLEQYREAPRFLHSAEFAEHEARVAAAEQRLQQLDEEARVAEERRRQEEEARRLEEERRRLEEERKREAERLLALQRQAEELQMAAMARLRELAPEKQIALLGALTQLIDKAERE